ncbi:MAG: 2,3-bisphosphoglycerate-independent phosphoglycerate mutase [Phycisphaerales bacterium]|nr:MAG: 2,3-bisphosphoglycerate-independent phosphoglycerate mutase [Phycisphaerales bacterium]
MNNSPVILIIRDGWGRNPHPEHDAFNAVKIARTPVADRLEREWPTVLIRTSGEDVGLPEGTMGNSEVGHQNIGAGRIVDQESVRITKAIRDGSFFDNAALREAIEHAKAHSGGGGRSDKASGGGTSGGGGGAVHVMGIASDAGVHGLLDHLYATLQLCKRMSQKRVYLHLFTDGRDTGPFTGEGFVRAIEARAAQIGVGEVASVMGRYYAMDRDNRWERVALAYACLTGRGERSAEPRLAPTALDALRTYYDAPTEPSRKGDEFVVPTMIGDSRENALQTRIRDGDSVIFFNYRGDRPREILRAFLYPEFHGAAAVVPSPDTGARGFDRGERLNIRVVGMTAYAQDLLPLMRVAFPKAPKMRNTLGEYLAALGLSQFRCAETEKFPHVTFFFNDYRDEPFPGERRAIIQSPRVSTYDQQPEMSAHGVRDAVLERLRADDCEPLIVVNFANGDMVGHTGSLDAAVKACECVDACVGAILEAALARGGCAVVTADHGNAEQMFDPQTNAPHTAHTTFDVPLTIVGDPFKGRTLRESGRLADIAPTMLDMLGLKPPPEMTGRTLLA